MNRFLSLTLVALMGLALLAGCAPAAPAQEQPTENKQFFVGALYDSLTVESRVRQRDELERYAKELGIRLVFQDGGLSEQKQMEQAESLISQGVDCLIIMAHNPEAMVPLVEMCEKNGVLLVFVDRLISNANYPYFVGWDNYFVGSEQAQFALRNAPKGNYVFLIGAPTDPNALEWERIWDEILGPSIESGDINIVLRERVADWDATIAANYTENALTLANDDIQVIMAMADILSTGAVQALKQRNLAGKVLVTGLDGELTAYQRIAEGSQHMTLQVDDQGMARKALDLVVAHLKGEDTSSMITGTTYNGAYDIPTVSVGLLYVDKDNLLDMIKLGYVTYDDAFANVPEADRPPRP